MAVNESEIIRSVGRILLEERQSQDWTLDQVSDRLKLPLERLEEIEQDNYNDAISVAFYRGYIRSYAQLLNINAADLIERFNNSVKDSVELKSFESLGVFSNTRRREVNSGNLLFKIASLLIIIALIVLMAWGIKERWMEKMSFTDINSPVLEVSDNSIPITLQNQPQTHEPDPNVPTPADQSVGQDSESEPSDSAEQIPSSTTLNNEFSQTTQDAAQQALSSVNEETGVNEKSAKEEFIQDKAANDSVSTVTTSESGNDSAESSSVEQPVEPVAEQSSVVGQDSLTMSFEGDCWVQVFDASGERLVLGIKKAGKLIEVQGVAPFSIRLGDASVVKMSVNGDDVDLSRYKSGQTAQLEVGK